MKTISKDFQNITLSNLEEKLKVEFKEIGFGVLHEIDFQETLINKIDKDINTFKQLQICNPQLAYEAIQIDPTIGIQLPCNVIIRKNQDQLTVDIQSPLDSIPKSSPEDLRMMATELDDRISRLLENIN